MLVSKRVACFVVSGIQSGNSVCLLFSRKHGMKINDMLPGEIEAMRLHSTKDIAISIVRVIHGVPKALSFYGIVFCFKPQRSLRRKRTRFVQAA